MLLRKYILNNIDKLKNLKLNSINFIRIYFINLFRKIIIIILFIKTLFKKILK